MASPIPPSKTDDPEDVSWALTTAETQWSRGDKTEALKWLRRAADAASDAEADMRALELAKAAAELSTSLASGAATTSPPKKTPPPPPATRKSVPPPAAGRASRPPKGEVKAKPAAPAAPAKPAPAPVKPTAAKVVAPVAPKPVAAKTSPTSKDPKPDAKEELRKTARKSYAGEVVGGRGAETESTETSATQLSGTGATAPTIALDATSRSGMPTKPPEAGAHDPDSWPTETLSGDDLPIPTFEHERTRIGAAAYRDARVERPGRAKLMQAVRVILYRAPDGSLRVAPEGTAVSAVAIEAMLVSLDPDVDLPSWLG